MFIFDALLQLRQNTLKRVENLNTTQLNKIPEGHNNNIIWHVGHMVASQQLLCYANSGTTPLLPTELLNKYRKGTSPLGWEKMVSLDEIKLLFLDTALTFEKDYLAKKFNAYKSYTTSAGATLNSIDDAITYSYGHENLHYGNIITMLKLIK
jgi:hypothetical protein